jgi:hypothetical protein
MREQLRLYAQSRLSSTSEFWTTSDQDFTEVGALKQILVEQLGLRAEQEVNLNTRHPSWSIVGGWPLLLLDCRCNDKLMLA